MDKGSPLLKNSSMIFVSAADLREAHIKDIARRKKLSAVSIKKIKTKKSFCLNTPNDLFEMLRSM